MKLPKQFGAPNNLIKQAQEAMAKMENLEKELESEIIEVDKGPVKATFNGAGVIQAIKLDPAIVDPEDIEALEDLLVSAVRDGLERANELRADRSKSIMPNLPF